jgi:sulfite reductase beta subunit-like hemoprotein
VKDPDIITELRPVLFRYAAERLPGERFGDWCHRAFPGDLPAQGTN